MRAILLAGALALAGCSLPAADGADRPSGDTARQLRVAAAAERGGQQEVALQIYANAAAANPGDPAIAARHAGALLQSGNPQAAMQALREARRLHPAAPALLQAEGRALLELGRPAEALTLFDRHLQAAPADVTSLNGRAVALDLLDRHAEAHAAYRAARTADPDNPLVAGNFALSLMLSGCPQRAASMLDTAPRSTETQAWLSQIQGLARGLSGPGPEVTPELRAAMPSAPERCTG